MKRGELRKRILDECPEEFVDELSNWINDIEQLVNSAKALLDSINIDNIGNIEDAYRELDNLSDGLY